jgi:PST family polysaccharide transporter
LSFLGTLKQSAATGVKWNLASQAGQQVAQLVTAVVLARLLTPNDYGLVGMAMVVIMFAALFKDLGTSAAVIREREPKEEFLSSVFWANAGFGALGTAALVAIAPLAARYYREPRVIPVFRVLALIFVISSLSTLQQALFERKLRFHILARIEVAGVVTGGVVGITCALTHAGVWALVAQSLTTVGVISLLLWGFSDWRPRLAFHWPELRRVGGYSLNLTGFNVVNYFTRNADNLLVGRYLGATPLGLYGLAYRIMLYPMQSIASVISRVMFPVYSQIRDDDARFRSVYLRTDGMIALITFPMMAGIGILAQPFVLAVFGPKWKLVIPVIRILAPVGMLQSVYTTIGSIYMAKGRTDVQFRWGLVSSTLYVTAFAVGLRWGISGVAAAYALMFSLLCLPSFMIPFRLIGLRLAEFVRVLAGPAAATLVMAAAIILALRSPLARHSPATSLTLMRCIGAVTYMLAGCVFDREQFRQALALVGIPRGGGFQDSKRQDPAAHR